MTDSRSIGGDTPAGGADALSAAAQQLAVAAFHGGDGVLDEPDRLAANGRYLPRIRCDGAWSVEGLGDFAIACPGKMTIEGADHQNEAPAQAGRDRPCTRNGACWATIEVTPKAQQSGETEQDIVVQRNEGGHPHARAHPP